MYYGEVNEMLITDFWLKFETILKFNSFRLGNELDLEAEIDKGKRIEENIFSKFYEDGIWQKVEK
jgi:hypothetical protein